MTKVSFLYSQPNKTRFWVMDFVSLLAFQFISDHDLHKNSVKTLIEHRSFSRCFSLPQTASRWFSWAIAINSFDHSVLPPSPPPWGLWILLGPRLPAGFGGLANLCLTMSCLGWSWSFRNAAFSSFGSDSSICRTKTFGVMSQQKEYKLLVAGLVGNPRTPATYNGDHHWFCTLGRVDGERGGDDWGRGGEGMTFWFSTNNGKL